MVDKDLGFFIDEEPLPHELQAYAFSGFKV